MHGIMRRRLLTSLAIATIAAPGSRVHGAAQTTPASRPAFEKRIVTTGLADPFQVIWGPDDYLWVTERTAGRVTRVLPSDGSKTPAIVIHDLLAKGPGGLLGMALDPGLLKGTRNDYVYVAYTYDADTDPATVALRMKIVRFTYDPRAHTLGNARDILTGLPAGTDHQGGRLIVGPDRTLYFTIGDLGADQLANFCKPNRAQSVPTVAQLRARDWSLYEGKVLRLNLDGSIPSDNPTIAGVKSHIYSYGHRNPQGLVFAPDGKLYESEHGPNTDDEVNVIRAGGNYGWPHVAGYQDDQSYAYANWSASKGVPCESLTFTAYPAVPASVPLHKESSWSHPDFTPPIQTFRTVPTGYDFKNPKCADRELYYQCWPTVAPSSLAVYAAKNGIPGWDHSLLMPSLKHGTVYRMQLDAAGTSVVGEPDENQQLKTVNRYRDVTVRPDGLALFIATDVGGNTQDESGRPAASVENPGAILEFRYVTDRSTALLGQTMNTLTAEERAQGWQLLFDGKTLAGWHASVPPQSGGRTGAPQPPSPGQVGTPKPCVGARAEPGPATPAGGSHWDVVDGTVTPCGEPTGYLTSDRSYKNFVLSIEFRCGEDTNSGVFVRAPQENGGYEVQIWRQQPAGYNTGAIVGTAKTARAFTFKPDQWNRYQITADGDHLVVELNGETTLDVHDAKFPEGQIRLQYQQFPIAFRNIRIRPLP